MESDIVDRNKRLRLTRKELNYLLLVLDAALSDEEDEAVIRAGQSAYNKLRSALQRLVAREARNDR